MSFLDVNHHTAQQHSELLAYQLHLPLPSGATATDTLLSGGVGGVGGNSSSSSSGGTVTVCLGCLLDSLADPGVLNTQKAYVVRWVRVTGGLQGPAQPAVQKLTSLLPAFVSLPHCLHLPTSVMLIVRQAAYVVAHRALRRRPDSLPWWRRLRRRRRCRRRRRRAAPPRRHRQPRQPCRTRPHRPGGGGGGGP